MAPELITDLLHFPRFWYVAAPAWWARFLKRLLIYYDNALAVTLMMQNWLVPVWQDTTIVGRGMSLIFRTVRIIFGSLIMLTVLVFMLCLIVAWLLSPLLLLLYFPKILLAVPFIWIIDASLQVIARNNDLTQQILNKSQADINRLKSLLLDTPEVQNLLYNLEKDELPDKKLEIDVATLVKNAQEKQLVLQDKKLKPEHLFLVLLEILKFHAEDAQSTYIWLKDKKSYRNPPWIWHDDYQIRPIGGVNRTWTGIITPQLDKVSSDLTQLAAHGKLRKIIGREGIVSEIVNILGKEGRENVLIVGEAGSGKTTLVGGLANEIIQGTQYRSLQFKRLIMLDFAALTSGTQAKIKERLVRIIDEIKFASNVILFVDEIHNFVSFREGQTSSLVFSALEPHLDAGEFQFVATTTPVGFKRYIEASEAFVRTFRIITLPPISEQDALAIVKWESFELERINQVQLSFMAIKNSVELAKRYIQDRVLPDSAVNLLEETANKARAAKKTFVDSVAVQEMVTEITNIPVRTADSKEERRILLNLEKELHQRVVGQDVAIEEISNALRRARTGMAQEGRLLASFLFAGATGVGKTETAKALAQVYFGSQKAMVRLDMSEYQTEDSINRLLGPPPGRAGYELGGQLTEAVHRRPFTVILLDELEKANKRILDVFLQLLDDARLTDGSGKTVDFSNTMLIATSNVGTRALMQGIEKGEEFEKVKQEVLNIVREQFRPEFLNRFTDVIVYKPLTQDQVREIAILQLKNLQRNLKEKEINLVISDELVNLLVQKGFSSIWGARELNRVIRTQVEEKIAKKILEGLIKPGNTYNLTPEFLS